MTASPSSQAAIQAEMRKLASMVNTARRLVCGGTMVDLSALEQTVEGICGAVQALQDGDGRALRPHLEALVRDLDGLADDLRVQHDDICGAAAGGRR